MHPRARSRCWASKLCPAFLLCLVCGRSWAFVPSFLAVDGRQVVQSSKPPAAPEVAEDSVTESSVSETPEELRQRLSAERVAALKGAVDEGDFGKILSALGIPLWLLPVVEVVITILELGLIYAGIKLLPAEFFGFLPQEVRTFLQIGVTDVQ